MTATGVKIDSDCFTRKRRGVLMRGKRASCEDSPGATTLFPAIGQELTLNRLGADQGTYEGKSVLDMRLC